MKPTMGRIVIMNYDRGIAPAVIQSVNEDNSVNLFVFGSDGQHIISSVKEGKVVGSWSWPERDTPVYDTTSSSVIEPNFEPIATSRTPPTSDLSSEVQEAIERSTKTKKEK